jgi:hypothetical protein
MTKTKLDESKGTILQGTDSWCEVIVRHGRVGIMFGRDESHGGQWWVFSCAPSVARRIAKDLQDKADEAEQGIS